MRIISKFKNVYDFANPYNDRTIVWVREESIIFIERYGSELDPEIVARLWEATTNVPRLQKTDVQLYLLCVAGRIHTIFHNTYTNEIGFKYDDVSEETPNKRVPKYFWPHPKEFSAWASNYLNFDIEPLHLKYKTPLILIPVKRVWQYELDKFCIEIRINPNLNHLPIQKIFDLFELYQEIEMYLSNVLTDVNTPMPDFGDELKRDAHGMDKWSFKQRGPKKRKRK